MVALCDAGSLRKAEALPEGLVDARNRVARDFGLSEQWLTLTVRPDGLRAAEGVPRSHPVAKFGDGLTVHFASRLDQIHFKRYALVDHGAGKHEQDLRVLTLTPQG